MSESQSPAEPPEPSASEPLGPEEPPEPPSPTPSPAKPGETNGLPAPAPTGFRGTRLWGWLQLFRVPNLLTVPGDPVAGFLLAAAGGLTLARPYVVMVMAAIVSLLVYAAGLLWNDYFDLPEDARERPSRPLPSGRIRVGQVALTANVLVAASVAISALAEPRGKTMLHVLMALGLVVFAYDWYLKRLPLIGPLAMGTCRGLSVLIGAAAFGPVGLKSTPVIAAAVGITLYVAAVTWLASGETRKRPVNVHRVVIVLAFVAWVVGAGVALVAADQLPAELWWAMLVVGVLAGLWLAGCLIPLGREPEPKTVQRTIGGLIRGIILVQAALVFVAGWDGLILAIALMACFLVNRMLGRVFYAS